MLGDLLGPVAAGSIDDPGAGLRGEDGLELRPQPVARADMVADVGAVEAGDDQPVVADPQLGEDVGAGAGVGGGGQRQPGDVGETVEQGAEQAIVGAEVMSPLADAMRLVDREQRDGHFAEHPRETLARRAFGGSVEQVEIAPRQGIADGLRILADAGQRGGAKAVRLGGTDLVLHQRDQRRDDDGGPGAGECGDLVAERLARPGRHDGEAMLPRHHAIDYLVLDSAKARVAKNRVEDVEGGSSRVLG